MSLTTSIKLFYNFIKKKLFFNCNYQSMSAYNRYFSPAQVESDHKDIVISQLKAQIHEAKKRAPDLQGMRTKLRTLESSYNTLLQNKNRAEQENAIKEDDNKRRTRDLRNQVAQLNNDLTAYNSEIQVARSEYDSFQDLNQQKAQEIGVLKKDQKDSYDEKNTLSANKRNLQSQLANLESNLRRINQNVADSNEDVNEEQKQNLEFQKYLRSKENEKSTLRDEANILFINKKELLEEGRGLEKEHSSCVTDHNMIKDEIRRLEDNLDQLEEKNQNLLNAAATAGRNADVERQKNNEVRGRVSTTESSISRLHLQVNDLKKELEKCNMNCNQLENEKESLSDELDLLKQHIDAMNEQNNDLMSELERFSDQDEGVRQTLNRGDRVVSLKISSSQALRSSQTYISSSSQGLSPGKTSPNKPRMNGSTPQKRY